MANTAVTPIPFGAVNFETYDYSCMCRDQREVECIKAEWSDPLSFQFIAAECTDDLVVGGDFPSSTSFAQNWDSSDTTDTGTPPSGWSFAGITLARANHIVGASNYLQQNGILTIGKTYKVTFTVKRVTNPAIEIEGSITPYCGTTPGTAVTAAGTYTQYIVATGTELKFLPTADFDGALDDISAYQMQTSYKAILTDMNDNIVGVSVNMTEMINNYVYFNTTWSAFAGGSSLPDGCYKICIVNGYDVGGCTDTEPFGDLVVNGSFPSSTNWNVGTNWSIAAGVATHTAGAAGDLTQTLNGMTSNLCYRITFTVSSYTAGTCNVSLAGTFAGTITGAGSYVFTDVIPNASNGLITFSASSTFAANIDDVTVTLQESCYPKSLCSQCFQLKTTHTCSKLISITNDNDAFGFDYTSFTPQFTQYMRVNAYLHKWKYPEDVNTFIDSQGATEVIYASIQKEWELYIPEQPEWVHDFFAIARRHTSFKIDSQSYICVAGDLVPELEDAYVFAPIKFQVRKTPDLNLNKNCK
jgi:hypothetical protein